MIKIFGEILLDMIQRKEDHTFESYLGGAPFNVAYAAHQITPMVSFFGNVGDDLFGKQIIETAKELGMDTSFITEDGHHNTTLAVVNIDKNGERNFCFMRKNGADYHLPIPSLQCIQQNDIVHLGSLMLSKIEGRNFAKNFIQEAKKKKARISFDINYRDDIFKSPEEAIQIYSKIIPYCDIVKISEDELFLFTHKKNLFDALSSFAKKGQKIFVTLGKNGSLLYQHGQVIQVPSIPVEVIDTTGAGDAFFGTILGLIDSYGYNMFFKRKKIMRQSLFFANVQGGLATTKKGALSGIAPKEILFSYKQTK